MKLLHSLGQHAKAKLRLWSSAVVLSCLPAAFPDLCWRAWKAQLEMNCCQGCNVWPHQQLQKLQDFCCSCSPNHSAFIDLCHVSFLLHPPPSHPSTSLDSFRQFGYSFTGKLSDTPDCLCCPFPKLCWFYRQFHSPHCIHNLGIYRVLVITYSVMVSM